MPKRTDIDTILIIGAGPIVIGQACEFDYSGTQACKVLRAEGYRVVLVNSNPATIMTDPEMADATYIEPITPEIVEKIIAREHPNVKGVFALLPTMGGQTALNTAKSLAESGVLKKYDVELIGAKLESINKAEDRELFNQAMARIGLEVPKNRTVKSMAEAREALEIVGLPAVIRPSFTMGGAGGGIAYNHQEFEQIIASGLDASPVGEVLIDESVLGWKEYEMEVVRDKADNCIIICSIENVDPMGVHTGDSITVAPALTLTDKEYQRMRDASFAVLREIGVDTGGSNVQFAVNPVTGRMIVIEMNPRVSRSSALASKATGFPIAKVAAKLAVGYTLDEIENDVVKASELGGQAWWENSDGTKVHMGGTNQPRNEKPSFEKRGMPASFEPTIDYVVTKIPRFTFEKFPGTEPLLNTSMKSVGEAMAMGRNFAESLQKCLRSLEIGLTGLNAPEGIDSADAARSALTRPTPDRLLVAAQALRLGVSVEEICAIAKYDPWFIRQLQEIVEMEEDIKKSAVGSWQSVDKNLLQTASCKLQTWKRAGFSDARIAELISRSTSEITNLRHQLNIHPVFKRVDTCAAEFQSNTPYMYSSYEGENAACESEPTDKKKIIILGGGPNRIGQGIEFDYCCVHACYALKEAGFETIMVNCNPETVSTDYDTADRLYFEPLTAEDVIEVIRTEQSNGELIGVIVQFGGQTPLKLAKRLQAEGIPIIGTSVESIDRAEDRDHFRVMIEKLGLKQPKSAIGSSAEEVVAASDDIGFPLLVRPSYVLGGRAMAIMHDKPTLEKYVGELTLMFGDGPILIDSFLRDAVEVDVDAMADGENVFVAGIMQHIEEAGIHSGDSACSLPPYSLSEDVQQRIAKQTEQLALELKVIGLMNVQYAVKDDEIYLIEVNPRASRTVPFVAKTIGIPLAKMAAQIMAGKKLSDFGLNGKKWNPKALSHVAVKEAVFPFARFPGVDVILGPEMKSTGEVMGIDKDFPNAFAKSQLGASTNLPKTGTVFISVRDADKAAIIGVARDLESMGYKLMATRGTASHLASHGVTIDPVNKVHEGRPHIVDYLKDRQIHLVINTTEGAKSIADSFDIRRTALLNKIPYYTTNSEALAAVQAMRALLAPGGLSVTPIQEYKKANFG